MRALTFAEVQHANGGLALDQAFFKQNVLYPTASGAVAGVVLGVVLGQSNLGRYAVGYASCFTAYALTTGLLSQTI